MKYSFLFFSFLVTTAFAQPINYSSANAHSHNDYEQKQPFYAAYNEQFGSIEADIHLVNGLLLVAHDAKGLNSNNTLEKLYLQPIVDFKNNKRPLQLLIDVKTDAIATLDSLVGLLKKFPFIILNKNIKIVISGNRPASSLFTNYPSYIWFDGRFGETYSPTELKKIGLISDDFGFLTSWKMSMPLNSMTQEKLISLINKAHQLNKPVRLYGIPDYPVAWEEMIRLGVDYINTDKINELSDYLLARNKSVRVLPYNRIIQSAGKVLRFGLPSLENHALDIAAIHGTNLAVIEERYGLYVADISQNKIMDHWSFSTSALYKKYVSTYSGIKTMFVDGKNWILWTAAETSGKNSSLMIAEWDNGIKNITDIPFETKAPAKNALPNEIAIAKEQNNYFIYVVLNGNSELVKINWSTKNRVWTSKTGVAPYGVAVVGDKIYTTNWAGSTATDSLKERAGVPWDLAYTNPITGATSEGSVSVFESKFGHNITTIKVGLHPTVIKASADLKFIYVANGSSDFISVINPANYKVVENINIGMLGTSFQGSTPNGLALNTSGNILYVSNGLDNAIAVLNLGSKVSSNGQGKSFIQGYIPTEAYPAGLQLMGNKIVVANLESDGANVIDSVKKARSIHQELASVSIIDLPTKEQLVQYTNSVKQNSLIHRLEILSLKPRKEATPKPVPERVGEPSVFKHVVYIIKENKTYDQVLGDMKYGRNDSSLTIFGNKMTPNTHALANQFGLMDDYNASGKSSAEGHQWTDAGMVSDYVEKNVRAWFRSYPHRQEDALVYNKGGFIWNHALDHKKTVRVFGEACETMYDNKLNWKDLYTQFQEGSLPNWNNKSTIQRLWPIISPTYPDCDNITFSDQQRASIFIDEWKKMELKDSLPNLMILSLPNDHTSGTSPNFPTPNAMVADNDLALGRIVEMISKSKFWDSTVIFVTEDDSQGGWDHISAYRTVGLVISAYSNSKLISTHYNQVSMLRTIEQILGIPPMNAMDATSRLMVDCFQDKKNNKTYTTLKNNIPLDQMNKPISTLKGEAKKMAKLSTQKAFNEVDGGEDDLMNRILWQYAKGNKPYPIKYTKF